MEKCLNHLKKQTKNEIITDSDLEEFENYGKYFEKTFVCATKSTQSSIFTYLFATLASSHQQNNVLTARSTERFTARAFECLC